MLTQPLKHTLVFFSWSSRAVQTQQLVRYLLVVFDVVLQDYSVGLAGFVPQQSHAVLTGVLLADR